MHKTKVITSIFNSLHPKAVQSPLNVFWISGPFKQIFLIRNHKWWDYSLQKVRVTDTRHCTESEKININLQVVNYRSLELKSLNYEEVFFVELNWVFWNSTVWPETTVVRLQVCIHKKYYLPYPLRGSCSFCLV